MDSSLISIEGEPKGVEPISMDESTNIVKLNNEPNVDELHANNTVDGLDGENDNQENNSNESIVSVEPVTDSDGSDHFSDDVHEKDEKTNNDKCEIDVNIPSSNQQMLIASDGFKADVPLNPAINQGPGKIYFVKFVPKPANQISSPTENKFTVVDLPNADKKDGNIDQEIDTKIKTTNPIVATTSSGNESLGEPSKPIGHTVNLLNNNRILIKSVKNKNCDEMNSKTTTEIKGDSYWSDDSLDWNIKPTLESTGLASNIRYFPKSYKIERDIQENKVKHTVNNATTVDKSNVVYSISAAPKIKREFEQLSKTVNESKILAEFVIDNGKRNRRSGKIAKLMEKANSNPMQSDMNELTTRSYSPSSVSRSASKDSDRSANSSLNSSNAGKRNTRSRNTDFSAKQKRFLKGIQQYTRGTDDESENNSFVDDDENDADFFNPDTKHGTNAALERRKSLSVSKLAKTNSEPKNKRDKYCWRCHQQQTTMFCSTCIRSYHPACIKMKQMTPQEMEAWNCSECIELKASEDENKKKKFDVRHFNKLLKYAMNRILQDANLQQFQFPVNKIQYPDYNDIIIYPIHLSKIEDNIDNLSYTNSEAFMSEIKWILHNCSIYFSDNYKVMRAAKSLQKVSKQEIYDIETCAECYLNANTMTDNWFTETCAKPHLILWAKLKGFPFWPAKAMSINAQMVDVRFFGEHDRAHVPSKDCYLYSLEDPNPPTNKYKRNTIADCVKEVDVYIENVKARFGSFRYAEIKTPFNPQTVDQHLVDMIPSINGARGRRKSIAKYDLTLKIVKTADNHLSVVKKDQPTKELPQIKRTIDITGDGAVSRTPTPPAQISSRRKTTTNRGKATARFSDGNTKFETTLDKKSYQVLRRKSMAVEKAEPKKVAAVIFKRKSIHSNSFANELEDSMSETNSNAEENSQTLTKANHSGKKRKPSNEQMEPPKQIPEKRTRVDASKMEKKDAPTISRSVSEEDVVREENILSSVGLMKRTSPLKTFIEQIQSRDPRKLAMAKRAGDKRNSNVYMSSKDESPTKNKAPIALIPFVEIKEETNKSPERNNTLTLNTTNDALSNAKETISLSSEDNSASIKTEIDSDEDSLMIIEDDFVDKTKETGTPNRSTINPIIHDERLAENIARGTISVRDISKMTDKEHKTAKKSFPKSSATATASILKPRTSPVSARTTPMNKMVCIPLDGLPRLDLISNSAPPPLAIVSSANSVSLSSRNQPTTSSSTVITNEPPPLSISSIQVTTSNSTSNQSDSSNSMPTITNGTITEHLASAITDAIVREPPKLTSRPKAPLRSDGDVIFATGAGSVSQTLMENAHKMTDFFRSVMEDTMKDLANTNLEPKVRTLELELEQLKNTHAKELADLRANTDRLLAEMKKSMEKERSRIIEETRKQCELERIRSVKEAKRKQWCAFCSSEAQFYCCWNTSYCSYTCQRKHWQNHMNHCSQVKQSNTPQPTQSNSRKSSASGAKVTVLKPDPIIIQPQLQSNQQIKSTLHGPKDRFNVNSGRSDSRLANNNSMVPGLRNILPKNAVISTNVPQRQQQQQQMLQQQQQHKAAPASQSSAIIINRSLMNSWGNSNQKSGSLLHPNTILLSSSPPSYATISAPISSSGVSLLSTNHTQKSTVSETIIIP